MNDPGSAPWLVAISAFALLGLSILTALVRAQAVNEGYTLVRHEQWLSSTRRHLSTVEAELLVVFADLEAGAGPPVEPVVEDGR